MFFKCLNGDAKVGVEWQFCNGKAYNFLEINADVRVSMEEEFISPQSNTEFHGGGEENLPQRSTEFHGGRKRIYHGGARSFTE